MNRTDFFLYDDLKNQGLLLLPLDVKNNKIKNTKAIWEGKVPLTTSDQECVYFYFKNKWIICRGCYRGLSTFLHYFLNKEIAVRSTLLK